MSDVGDSVQGSRGLRSEQADLVADSFAVSDGDAGGARERSLRSEEVLSSRTFR